MWSKHCNYTLVNVLGRVATHLLTDPPTQLLCLHAGSGRKHWTSLVSLLASFDSLHHI